MAKGKVVQVIGPVVDIEFPAGELPEILNAVTIKGKAGSAAEKYAKDNDNPFEAV